MDLISIRRPDGGASPAAATGPSGPAAPAVVLVQEWWGLNDQIRGVAARLAEEGYRVLVPDLFRGRMTLKAAEAEHLMQGLDFADAATQDIRGAVQHLKHEGRQVAVVGFCMGGALSILAAMHVPEADAFVSWYGVPPAEAGDPGRIDAPVQGHFALQDTFFPSAAVDEFEQRLGRGASSHEIFRYDAAHAFGNEEGASHDARATALAWQRTLRFLEQNLVPRVVLG